MKKLLIKKLQRYCHRTAEITIFSDFVHFNRVEEGKRNLTITFPTNTYPGITLTNTLNGCKIKKLHKRDRCYLDGLRVGQIISHINDLECNIGHENVVLIMDAAAKNGITLKCTIQQANTVQVFFRRKNELY